MSKTTSQGSALEGFLALSRILTGVENLDAELGRQYLDRLTSTPLSRSCARSLSAFEEGRGDRRPFAQRCSCRACQDSVETSLET